MEQIGKNIIVFDFIAASAQAQIFEVQLERIGDMLRQELGLKLELEPHVKSQLAALCTAGDGHGLRWIEAQLDTYLISPLSRVLFDENVPRGARVTIGELNLNNGSGVELSVTVSPMASEPQRIRRC
jgi:ATP-dependent Clp protease ATP-binding subunit ClpA